MRERDKRTATENVRFSCFIVQEKTQENPRGGGEQLAPPALIRPGVILNSNSPLQERIAFLSCLL